MKIVLVHDYIKEYGGAERVLEALHEMYPDAPVFTSVYLPEFLGPHRERFNGWDIRTSFLQYFPLKDKLISLFRVVSPFVFRTLDFSNYDIVIVSATGAYFPNSIICHPEFSSGSQILDYEKEMLKPASPASTRGVQRGEQVQHDKVGKPIHICYCHTPPKYLYGYATAREWKKNIIFRVLGEIANHFLRLVDFKAAQNVDYFVANSEEVKSRIKKFYKRESTVIYPPVETSMKGKKNTKYSILNTAYFLAGGRLARPKNIDLIVRACEKLKVPLKVFGREFVVKIKDQRSKIKDANVEFVGEITDEEKYELMRNAKAYIFASEDEDFGITPVEAMSVGTPVIAYRSGGVQESVIDGKTGIFFDKLTVDSLSKAMQKFNSTNYGTFAKNCIQQAEKFSKERFKTQIRLFVESAR